MNFSFEISRNVNENRENVETVVFDIGGILKYRCLRYQEMIAETY